MKSVHIALAALLALAAAPAEAQLGGLRRRLEQKIGLPEASAERAPAFSERVLEITDARLDQLVRGLRAEQAEAAKQEQRNAAENARAAAYEKKQEAYAACAEPYTK